jgi:hypothetical protein
MIFLRSKKIEKNISVGKKELIAGYQKYNPGV